MHPVSETLRANARRLRREMTGPEKRLWAKLRGHRLAGIQFRRQAPLGNYIVDFVTHAAKLVVELDGDQHGQPAALAKDQTRDTWLASNGYRVLRFSNWQVMNETESVLLTIEAHVKDFTPSLPSP